MGNVGGKDVQQYITYANSSNPYERRKAARELCKIACSGSKPEEMMRADAIMALVFLSTLEDRDSALNAIIGLSVMIEQGQHTMLEANFYEGYQKNLVSEDTELRLATTKLIANYVMKSQKPLSVPQEVAFILLSNLLAYHEDETNILAASLLSLFSTLESYRVQIIISIGLDPILDLCRSPIIDTRCLALASLGNLVIEVPNKISLYQLDGLKVFLDSVDHESTKVKTYASNAICHFFDNCETMLHRMDEDVFRILGTLSRSTDRDAQRAAAKIFCQLSSILWFACSNCMKEPLQDVRWTCLNCPTYNLCDYCYKNEKEFAFGDHSVDHMMVARSPDGFDVRLMSVIQVLVELSQSNDGLVTLLIIETFANLAKNRKNRVEMVSHGVFGCFRQLCNSKSIKIQRIIISTFADLIEEIENCEVAVNEHLQLVIGMTRSSDLAIQQEASRALSSLCAIDGELKQHIINEGGLQCLVCFAYSMDKKIQQYTSLGIRNLMEKLKPLSMTYILKNGGLQPVYHLSTCHDQMIQLNMASTLFNIASNGEAIMRLEETEGLCIIRNLMLSRFESVRAQAIEFVALLKVRTKSPQVLKAIEQMEADYANFLLHDSGAASSSTKLQERPAPAINGRKVNSAMVRLKCIYGSETRLVVVDRAITYDQLMQRIKHDYNMDLTIRYEDEEGDQITIKSDNNLQEAFNWHERSGGNNFKLTLIPRSRPQSRPLDILDSYQSSGRYSDGGSSTPSAQLSDAHRAQILKDNPEGWVEISFDDLTIEDRIGSGSFCIVRRAKWADKTVALKIFREEIVDAEMLEIFRSELTVLSKLSHPNIISLLGAITTSTQLCIVTDYMAQGSLFDVLHRNIPIDDFFRFNMATEIAKGISYLHNRNPSVIHRDLKSANILVDEDWNIKICDLGLSRVKLRTYCMSGFSNGTFGWMSPECIRNEKYNEKADIYSYGVVLWEIVTRRVPYQNMLPIQIATAVAIQNQKLEIPSSCNSCLASLMDRCWSREPSDRPTADEIIQQLYDTNINSKSAIVDL